MGATTLIVSSKPSSTRKSKEEGEENLARLVKSLDMVGVFVYSCHDSVWYNMGFRPLEGNEVEKAFIAIEASNVDHAQFGPRTVLYHVHPLLFENKDYDLTIARGRERDLDTRLSPEDWQRFQRYARNICAARTTIPYEQDLMAFLNVLETHTNQEVGYRVVSPHGILTVEFCQESVVSVGKEVQPEFFPDGKVPAGIEGLFDASISIRKKENLAEYKSRTVERYVDKLLDDVMIEKGKELFVNKDISEAINNAIQLINDFMEGRLKLTMQYFTDVAR